MKRIIFTLLLIAGILSGCSGDQCIDADDFGFAKFTISSRYPADQLSSQRQDTEVAPWLDTGLRVNGLPLAIVVRTWEYGQDDNSAAQVSAWCPWFGDSSNTATLSAFCARLQPCTFIGGTTNTNMCTHTKDAQINNAPCLFHNGVGLYGLIGALNLNPPPGTSGDSNPNVSFVSERNPAGLTFHLGENITAYNLYDLSEGGKIRPAGGIIYQYPDSSGNPSDVIKQTYADAKLYFKILDKFYDDNNGQYRIVIKSGVTDNQPDPIQFLTHLIKNYLFGTSAQSGGTLSFSPNTSNSTALNFNSTTNNYGLIQTLYLNITQNPGYRNAVTGMLTLYIMFTALSFLVGSLNITHTELIVRVIKVAIVSALLTSTYSWSFFNDYLFVYFVGGVEQIIQLIEQAGATGPGSVSILGLMIAPQTLAKLLALLLMDWRGIFFLILFVIALYLVVTMLFKAAILYLTALMAIGLIITLAPIFLCFILFDITKSLFENWLRQLISYALQPIILFTGIVFISVIIRTEIYSSLGFRVCRHDFPNLGPMKTILGGTIGAINPMIQFNPAMQNSIFTWWFPVPMRAQDFTRAEAVIPVPLAHFQADGTFCQPYGCFENRYIELPFLDPVTDSTRIENFFEGNFLQFDSLLIIFLSVYLLRKFNDITLSLSTFLAGTSGNLTSLATAGQQAFAPVQNQLNKPVNYAKAQVNRAKTTVGALGSGAIDNLMTRRIGNQALNPSSANSAVLAEVKRNYGMDHRDVNAKAIGDYRNALGQTLRTINPQMSDKELQETTNKLSSKNYKGVKDEFSALKFGKGKKYDDLSKHEKAGIDQLMQSKFGNQSLRSLLSDARYAEDFRDAYIQSHQSMSNRGIGLFGKNIKAFRSIQEIRNDMNSREKLSEAKRYNLGERIYSGYEGVKSAATGGRGGQAWHGIDNNDPRMRTYSESLKDTQRGFKVQELQTQISRESTSANTDILHPEYMANLSAAGKTKELNYYQNLSRQEIAHEVRQNLSSGDRPALMGEKYLREVATDDQSRGMIDRAYQLKDQMMSNDRYIRREDNYEVKRDEALDVIKEKYSALKTSYPNDNITALGGRDTKLQKAIQEFERSQQVLEQIAERKLAIDQEVNGHVDDINRVRASKGQPEYNVSQKRSPDRRMQKLDDYLK